MAIKRIKINENAAININDSRISGIDDTPTQGSTNVVKSGGVYTELLKKEATTNKVTSLSSASTDTQYPSAKCVYDLLYETALVSLVPSATGTASDLIGLAITVTDTDSSEIIQTATWQGAAIPVRIKAGVNYTVSVQAHGDYITPAAQSFTSKINSMRSVVFVYVYSAAIDLSYRDYTGAKVTNRTTANSYIVRASGDYKIPAIYGSAIKNGATNSAAYTRITGDNTADFVNYKGVAISSPYIETDTGESIASASVLWQTGSSLISDVAFSDGFVAFTVSEIPSTNALAVLCVRDSNGDIMWSWTLWLTNDDLTPLTFENHTEVEYYLMPENLFTIFDSNRTYQASPHVQWGRPSIQVPNVPNSSTEMTVYDGNGDAITAGTTLGSAIGIFGTDQDQSSDKTVANAIKNPGMFFTRYDSTNHNWNNLTAFYNFWNAALGATGTADNQDTAVKTVYDPCPAGWMLPAGRAFTGFTTTGANASTVSEFNVIGSFNKGWTFKRNSTDVMGAFFPAAGCRSSGAGAFTGVGGNGYYWSFAAYSRAYAYYLRFFSSGVYPVNNFSRSSGLSVRPSRES